MMTQYEYWALCRRHTDLEEKSQHPGLSRAEWEEHARLTRAYQVALKERWSLCEGYQTVRKIR